MIMEIVFHNVINHKLTGNKMDYYVFSTIKIQIKVILYSATKD